MSVILILKLILVPALIAGITLAGRRWGPAVAGWLSAFPVVSGPILLFMALEQGPAFTATAATATLSAVLAGALLVMLVTHFAARMGPGLSGVLAMFPVMGSVLVVFSHRHAGASFAIHLLRGMVLGYYAFGAFCTVLALTLPSSDIQSAFLLALGAAVSVQAMSRSFELRRPPNKFGVIQ